MSNDIKQRNIKSKMNSTNQELTQQVKELTQQVKTLTAQVEQLSKPTTIHTEEDSLKEDVERLQRTVHTLLHELFHISHQPVTHERFKRLLFGEFCDISDIHITLEKLRYENNTKASKTEWVSATTNQGRYLEDCVSNIENDVTKVRYDLEKKCQELEEMQNNQAGVIRRLIDGLFDHGTQHREIETLRSQLDGDETDSPEVFFPITRQGNQLERRVDYLDAMLSQHGFSSSREHPLDRS